MSISLFYQPIQGQLGELLKARLLMPYTRLTIWSAFAKMSGVLRLKPALKAFKTRNSAKIRAFIGVDLDGTTVEALEELWDICDELYVIHSDHDGTTFHPKMYLFEDQETAWVAVGSNNFTGGGLWSNMESSVLCEFEKKPGEEAFTEIYQPLEKLTARYQDPTSGLSLKIQSRAEIEALEAADYIHPEQLPRKTGAGDRVSRPAGSRMFSSQVLATLPALASVDEGGPATVAKQADETIFPAQGRCLWMETRKLTGGSANQLEPSANGVLISGSASNTIFESEQAGRIKGSIVFFGLEPGDAACVKHITVQYNGVDYIGCTIEHKPGNSNWRIVLKGRNSEGKEIQRNGAAGWLKHKLLVFEKLSEDRYRMTVYDESFLAELEAKSVFCGASGRSRNNRRYGLI